MQKTLIRNAQIATSTDVFCGSVLVEEGKISRIIRDTTDEAAHHADLHILEAAGKLLLPGGVDAHTHFDLDVGFARASDDFYTGSVAAACGGTTTIIDHMAFGPAGCPLGHQVEVYKGLAEKCVVDYGLHGVIQHVDDGVLADMERLRDEEGITSHKVYLTYDYKLEDRDLFRVLERAQALGLVMCAHCENDAILQLMRGRYQKAGLLTPRYHALSRPAEAEAEAVFRMLMLARAAGEARVYVVHLSTALGMYAVRLARAQGQKNIFAETCPQYLLLDDSLYEDDAAGLKYVMSPPLRKPGDIDALWGGLRKDDIDTIGTDHCPFFFESQKQRGARDFTQCPNGAPGVELRLALLYSEGVKKGRITLPELVRLCSTRPAEIFGLAPRKGDIREGADADFVLFNPDVEWTVTKAELHENVDYTPYEGMQLTGRPVLTISRGEVIAENGRFTGGEGRGQYLRRNPAFV